MLRIVFVVILFCSALYTLKAQEHEVLIKTNLGNMRFMLYDDTPLHRNAFIQLADNDHFDGTLFYRVIEGFMIQGGSKDSRNAPPGKFIGYGDPTKTVNDEILNHRICKKGALCAPRQPNNVNIFKQSDISQFFIVQGRKYRLGQLDTMELAINRPIRKQIVKDVYPIEKRNLLKKLKEEKRWEEARKMADSLKQEIEIQYALNTDVLTYTNQQRDAYTAVGGAPEIENEYTVFGEIVEGIEIIDKIASLKTDENDRPLSDIVITIEVIK